MDSNFATWITVVISLKRFTHQAISNVMCGLVGKTF
jgi:hypothetical protein